MTRDAIENPSVMHSYEPGKLDPIGVFHQQIRHLQTPTATLITSAGGFRCP
jgi:hypothetical protein